MLTFFPAQTAKEKPIPETPVSAKYINWEKMDPSLARYSLEQAQAFYLLCKQLDLPVSSPFAFFSSFYELLADSTSLKKHAAQFLSLLLLYNAHGNILFDSSYPGTVPLSARVSSLLSLNNISDFRQELCSPSLHKFFEQVSQKNRNNIFRDGAEFSYCEDLNCRFASLREEILGTPIDFMPNTISSSSIDANEATALCEIFCNYHAEISRTEAWKYVSTYAHLNDRLKLSLKLHHQSTDFSQITSITLESLSKSASTLIKVLDEFPQGTVFHEDLAQLHYHYRRLSDTTSTQYYDEHICSFPKKKADLSFALAALSLCAEEPYEESINPLQNHLQNLLNCYQADPLFTFFTGITNVLESHPMLKPYASAYVWMLFHHYANRIFKASPSMLKGKKSDSLSFAPLFNELQDELLSEERTSERHLEINLKLFDKLVAYYSKKGPSYIPDRPMCEYFLSRLLRKQIFTFSNTNILGLKLKHAKPLFRNLAVFHDHLSQIHSNLWQTMPRETGYPVEPEDAKAFFENNMSHDAKVMKHLLERSARVPDSRKKVLTLAHCEEIVRIVFFTNEKNDTLPQQLRNWMLAYFNSDPLLRSAASQSDIAFANMQFAVYRLALERYAKSLCRKLMRTSVHVLYYPIPDNITSYIWETCFSHHRRTCSMNRFSDQVLVGEQIFPTRIIHSLPASHTENQFENSNQTPSSYIVNTENPCDYSVVLQKNLNSKFLFRPLIHGATSTAYPVALMQSIFSALESGFNGIVISSYDYDLLPSAFSHKPLFNDRFILELENHLSAFLNMIQSIRRAIGSHPIIMLKINIPSNYTNQDKKLLRILTRWFSDNGANGIILSSTDSVSPTFLSKAADAIASASPIPIFIEASPFMCRETENLLQQHQISGLVLLE